jgi:glycosyltransferase involved in cell wall biosynthesis
MKIHGLVVSVNYADLLALSIERWATSLDSLTVVTTHEDKETGSLAARNGCRVFWTDAFYRNGASFNKGAAMEEARQQMPWKDWILFFDADIVPPEDWFHQVQENAKPGFLNGARRYQAATKDDLLKPKLKLISGEGPGVGYFQLFRHDDLHARSVPLLETCWPHAGVYDSAFLARWHKNERHMMPLRLAHVGTQHNWFGRDNAEAYQNMQAEREKRGGWNHERMEATA